MTILRRRGARDKPSMTKVNEKPPEVFKREFQMFNEKLQELQAEWPERDIFIHYDQVIPFPVERLIDVLKNLVTLAK